MTRHEATKREYFFEAGEYTEFATERRFAEEEVEDGGVVVLALREVGVGHSELVEVGQ